MLKKNSKVVQITKLNVLIVKRAMSDRLPTSTNNTLLTYPEHNDAACVKIIIKMNK